MGKIKIHNSKIKELPKKLTSKNIKEVWLQDIINEEMENAFGYFFLDKEVNFLTHIKNKNNKSSKVRYDGLGFDAKNKRLLIIEYKKQPDNKVGEQISAYKSLLRFESNKKIALDLINKKLELNLTLDSIDWENIITVAISPEFGTYTKVNSALLEENMLNFPKLNKDDFIENEEFIEKFIKEEYKTIWPEHEYYVVKKTAENELTLENIISDEAKRVYNNKPTKEEVINNQIHKTWNHTFSKEL